MNQVLLLAQAGFGGGMGGNVMLIGGLIAIMYFVMIRPQQKQAKEQQNLLSSLKKGDDVITQGGLLGKIALVTDKVVTLDMGGGVKLRMLKSSVQGKVTVTSEEPAKADDAAGEKKEEK